MTEVTADQLIGSWTLVSWEVARGDGTAAHPFGREPEGLITYGADGVVTATVCARGRAGFSGGSPRKASAERQAAAYTSYFHYAGEWRLEGGAVHHRVTLSLNPDFVGTTQVRDASLERDRLTLSALEDGPAGPRGHRL
ncbi:MAG: lipocalin-like domain-containing protein, partial [Caulobacterales bacterium]|nr:lipocalin-like domain-containing protein [Caulobacterales bacterium]